MLQIGRFLCRGQGAMLVTGPLGAALVPLDFADSAADVVWGRADTQAWLSHVQAEKGDALLLDCAGEQPYLTVLGNIQLRMRAAGQITEQVWTDPIWAWPFNPGEWQTFEATIIDGDEVTWMVPAADRVEAYIRENDLDITLEYGAFPDRPYDSPGVWGDATKIRQILATVDGTGE